MKKYFLALTAFALMMGSCKKEEKISDTKPPVQNPVDTTKPYNLQLNSNSPTLFGDNLVIEVKNPDTANYIYTITGPGGNVFNGTRLARTAAMGSAAGWYRISASAKDTLEVLMDSLFYEVNPLPVPCSPPANKLQSDSGLTMNFSDIQTFYDSANYYFHSLENTLLGDITVRLGHKHLPENGRTYLTSNDSVLTADEAEMKLYVKWEDIYYPKPGQHIHFRTDSTKTTLTACDLIMEGSTTGNVIRINAKVKVD